MNEHICICMYIYIDICVYLWVLEGSWIRGFLETLGLLVEATVP